MRKRRGISPEALMTPSSSIETQASGTAAATTFLRALAACDPREDLRGKDHLAEIFLEENQTKPLHDPALRAWVMQHQLSPGAYAFMLARTAFFDHVFAQALQARLEQVVLLGAGYDSRPYRFNERLQAPRTFEVDALPTQQRKQARLRQAGISIPPCLSLVPVNFEADNVQDVLCAAGLRRESQTLFIWEGVSYYLSATAVDNVLAWVKALSPAGSTIAFDYAALSPEVMQATEVQGFRKSMQARHADEPTRFGIRAGTVETFLAERGFQIVEHLTAADMNERYCMSQRYPDVGQVLPLFGFVRARVASCG
jgi:methyltransferase (TIGR00027 family)